MPSPCARPVEGYEASYAVEGRAALAVAWGEYRRAVRLFTAAARTRSRLEGEIEPGWQDQIAPFQARAAAELPPAARQAAEAGGRAMAWPALGPV
ncbi:hypothetical protein [Streptomyces sp. AK02-04a]|uniref:hypothetical protein n=1 Tax=Streptomyces sp. AK02-04a TaxID=3028649 RepID=UPI0029A26272|nr:hypothetical protein [Streptomyces sp. AK02-04a]MDX3764056.1 hypothetical protein [Streptomyces sp. AK02-04a]